MTRTGRSPVSPRGNGTNLHLAGYAVLRITWDRLTTEPEVVTADLAAALARSSLLISPS
ncbi:MAG: hypothetical protein M3P50_08835 [Actinomycetota bacterium]|nr:hypothetical protein [Actinomycetota bacterium]